MQCAIEIAQCVYHCMGICNTLQPMREREREITVYSTKCSETPKGINLISRGTGATNVTMQPVTNIYCVFT